MGRLQERGLCKNISGSLLTALAGITINFALGVPVLAIFIGWHKAIAAGFYPFIMGELYKLAFIASFIPNATKQISRYRENNNFGK